MPTAARWPWAAPSSLSSSRFGLTMAKPSGSAAGAFVMVDDDHVDAGRLGHGQRLERLGAAIDGDDQLRAALGDPHQRLARRAVALHQPVGDIGLGGEPELAQQPDQQGGRGRAVDVIVAEDGDRLACARPRRRAARPPCPCRGTRDGSGMKPRRVGGRCWRSSSSRGDAAREQQLVDEVVGLEARVDVVRRRAAPAPGLAHDRARHAADEGRGHQHRPVLGDAGPEVNPVRTLAVENRAQQPPGSWSWRCSPLTQRTVPVEARMTTLSVVMQLLAALDAVEQRCRR